jgi:hypothetical protein
VTDRIIAKLLICVALATSVGCSTTPTARFYALSVQGGAVSHAKSALVVAVGPVEMPEYLDRPQIVTRVGDNRLSVDEFNRWGGRLDEEIVHVLTQRIGQRLGTQHVYGYPSRVSAQTDYRIVLALRRFDGTLGGEVVLDVAWSLIDDRSGQVVAIRQASYRQASGGADFDVYAATLSAVLARLGDDLGAALESLPAGGAAR